MTAGTELDRDHTRPAARHLVVPAIVAATTSLLWVSNRRTAAVLGLLATTVLLHAVLLSASFRRLLDAFAGRVAALVAPVLSLVFLLPVYVVVITPLGLVMRAVGARPLDLSLHRSRGSYWTIRTAGTDPRPASLFAEQRGWHPSGSSPSEQRRLVAGAVVATLLVQALAVGGWVALDRRRSVEPELGGASSPGAAQSAALRDLEWVPEAMQEIGDVVDGIVYTSFTGISLRDHAGQYVNVQHRIRASYESSLAETDDPVDIWFFGGSTMFGFDLQRDEHTIPSEVVRLAEDAGLAVRAHNYGAPGYVSYQESVLLSLLVTAEPPPDLVVFYDGINDVSVQLLAAIADFGPRGEPADLGSEQQRRALAVELGVRASTAPPVALIDDGPDESPLTVESLVADIVDVYGQGIDLSTALATQHGFEVAHFWQPDIYSKAKLDPGEAELLEPLGLDAFRYDAMVGLEARVRAALPGTVVDIAGALDGVEGPVLADQVHINEVGARAVAVAMFAELRPTLQRLQLPSQ